MDVDVDVGVVVFRHALVGVRIVSTLAVCVFVLGRVVNTVDRDDGVCTFLSDRCVCTIDRADLAVLFVGVDAVVVAVPNTVDMVDTVCGITAEAIADA